MLPHQPHSPVESNVDRTLYILQNPSVHCHHKDVTLLTDLKAQLFLYCSLLQSDGGISDVASKLSMAIPYLSRRISMAPDNNNHTNSNGIICTIENGKTVYLLEGKRIRFKVLKNRPKNGEFKLRWNRNLEELKEYYEKNGHTRVTRTEHKDLGNWVAEQRRKIKKGKITYEQFQALNDIGFEWDRSSYFFNTYQKNDNHSNSQ